MESVFTHLRGIKRLLAICGILLRQCLVFGPFRFLFGPSAETRRFFGRYLSLAGPRLSHAEIARETLQRLGPTYIKFGQFLSIRPDLVPPEFCEEFKKLQDRVPPFSFALVQREIRQELKRELSEVFSEFDETPMAAASVAQVHRARLLTGEEVAVKVQRPGIRDAMVADLFIMLRIAHLIERFVPSLRKNTPVMLVKEFTRWTDRELYFRQEGKNALHFAYNFRDYPGVRIPKVYREFTTRKVLVMEHLSGVNVFHAAQRDVDRPAVARRIADSMLKQIFIDGFFHGDPHGGNILLLDRDTIAYLDFGIVGYLPGDLRSCIFDILYGISGRDVPRVVASFLELCSVREEDVDIAAYRREMNEIVSELPVYEVAGVPFTQMLERILRTSLTCGLPIPHDFVLVTKALATFEGTCLSLDPEVNIVDHLRTFVRKCAEPGITVEELQQRLKAAPYEVKKLSRMILQSGARAMKFFDNPAVRIESSGGGTSVDGDATGANIAYGFIIASLILFAGLVSDGSDLERWFRSFLPLPAWPVLSLASLGGAILLFLGLLVRNRRRRDP
ncbi:MAG: AarF/UbiB family protein [Nitrospiraceae bacterium]|nr:AarF/UbiB family protein [Nitrospiraceae bacterium]